MNAYEAIVTKRDTREYEAQPIAPDHLARIVQAGRMAGSSKNEQPIRLLLLTEEADKVSIATCADFAEHLPRSPLVVIVVRLGASRPFDAGRVAQNMMIAANELGIASCPVAVQHDDCAREVLGDWCQSRAGTLSPRGNRRSEPRW
ncbi:MAG: nitroreductase family protein [Chloroflexi bacterium]|nr:nitroreductase family protein [Chloroflexota bacterium]